MTATLARPSADSRFANTQPALPAPTMTWSKAWSMRRMGARAGAAVQGGEGFAIPEALAAAPSKQPRALETV